MQGMDARTESYEQEEVSIDEVIVKGCFRGHPRMLSAGAFFRLGVGLRSTVKSTP